MDEMGYVLKIYEVFRDLGEDKAKTLAEVIEYLENQKAVTSQELKETELALIKEIEQVRKDLKETELKLTKEIEQVRKELKEIKADFIKWSFLFWLGQIGVVVTLIKLFFQ